LGGRDEALGRLRIVLVEVLEAVEEAKIEAGWLGAVVDQEGWILSSLTHVESAEVQGALLTASLLKDDREVLLDARCRDLNRTGLLLSVHMHLQESRDEVRLGGRQGDADPPNLLWLDAERAGLHFEASAFQWVDVQVDVACQPALILELDLLVLGCLDGNEPEVDQRLELDVWRWPEGVQEELELLVVALSLDLNDVVEVALLIRLERDVHLHCQPGCERTLHVVLDLELGGLGAGELEPPHSLADVPDCDGHLVVLVGLNVCSRETG
jgi:hypothetical protein